jgi:hypothetical protein
MITNLDQVERNGHALGPRAVVVLRCHGASRKSSKKVSTSEQYCSLSTAKGREPPATLLIKEERFKSRAHADQVRSACMRGVALATCNWQMRATAGLQGN